MDGGGYLQHVRSLHNCCNSNFQGGLMEMKEPQTGVVLEAQLVMWTVADVTAATGNSTNVPSFIAKEGSSRWVWGQGCCIWHLLRYSFALVDTEKNFGIKAGPDTAGFQQDSQASCYRKLTRPFPYSTLSLISHLDLVENYSTIHTQTFDLRNLVVCGDPADPH